MTCFWAVSSLNPALAKGRDVLYHGAIQQKGHPFFGCPFRLEAPPRLESPPGTRRVAPSLEFASRTSSCQGAASPKRKTSAFAEVFLFGGATQTRTGESRICSPLPYHLAMAPYTGFADLLFANPFFWSGLRGSNSLPPPWQGGALPDELCPQMVPPVGVEPTTRGFSVRCSTY